MQQHKEVIVVGLEKRFSLTCQETGAGTHPRRTVSTSSSWSSEKQAVLVAQIMVKDGQKALWPSPARSSGVRAQR